MVLFNSSGSEKPLYIAVVIATKDRAKLLTERAIPSVFAQHQHPNLVVIVDDSPPFSRHKTTQVVTAAATRSPDIEFRLLVNQRAAGASGAWNTALHFLAERCEPSFTAVFFLDDDDEWLPNHIQNCIKALQTRHLSAVATGMVRVTEPSDNGRDQFPPELWIDDLFLVGNPHIQASNLAVRLDILQQAGLFNEALLSCTDRDLCLRMLAVTGFTYGNVNTVTVRHFAESGRPRLSTPGSRAKHRGLDEFWRIYRHRMTTSQHTQFLKRCKDVFSWSPPD
ncbi:MAG: glycosyltransferase family 2 protein [Myxococcales bacterium]|nr:glycosyltransferase family 2 protein [Myxococcales bacterium]